jgi:hypothetical protein
MWHHHWVWARYSLRHGVSLMVGFSLYIVRRWILVKSADKINDVEHRACTLLTMQWTILYTIKILGSDQSVLVVPK